MIGTLDPSLGTMMYADTLKPVLLALARRAADAEGVMVDWLELKRQGGSWVVRVFIDREVEADAGAPGGGSGASLDDCERVSRRLSLLLDVEDPIESSYTLEVSTPGLDRPLRRERDYERFAGRLAKVQTKEPISGRRRFAGRISGLKGGHVELTTDEGERFAIPFAKIEKARLEVELPSSREGKR